MRRVVVTGLGMVSPLGCGVEPTWTRLLSGKSGAVPIDRFDVSDLPALSTLNFMPRLCHGLGLCHDCMMVWILVSLLSI